jgi:hypothetical protein
MRLFETLGQLLSRLDEHGTSTALLGGLAVSAWTEPRFTRDVDLAVAVMIVYFTNRPERLKLQGIEKRT